MPRVSTPQHSTWFVVVVAVFITSLVVSNIIAVKLANIFRLILPALVVMFPVSDSVGDVLTECYGYGRVRQVMRLECICDRLVAIGSGGAGDYLI